MSAKPETTFIASVHKHMPEIYFEKQHNMYRSGTADVWYSGATDDLWCEYKFSKGFPKKPSVPDLSARQIKWLHDRRVEGRNVAVIWGTTLGGVIYIEESWLEPQTQDQLLSRILTRKELADWITQEVGKSPCKSLGRSHVPPSQ